MELEEIRGVLFVGDRTFLLTEETELEVVPCRSAGDPGRSLADLRRLNGQEVVLRARRSGDRLLEARPAPMWRLCSGTYHGCLEGSDGRMVESFLRLDLSARRLHADLFSGGRFQGAIQGAIRDCGDSLEGVELAFLVGGDDSPDPVGGLGIDPVNDQVVRVSLVVPGRDTDFSGELTMESCGFLFGGVEVSELPDSDCLRALAG